MSIVPQIQEDRVVIYVSLSFHPFFRRHPFRLHLIEARIELQEVDRKHRSESGILSQNKDKSAIILPRKGSLVFGREYNLVSHLSLPLQPLEEGYKVQRGMCSLGKFRSVYQLFCVQIHKKLLFDCFPFYRHKTRFLLERQFSNRVAIVFFY